MREILVTGSQGLVGASLVRALERSGRSVRQLDLRSRAHGELGDVRDKAVVQRMVNGSAGVIHLAAVSRVVWGERDPEGCWDTNVRGTRNVLEAALLANPRPWVVFSSSREVYGPPDRLPVTEDAPLRPINLYGFSKAEGERFVLEARGRGVRTAVVRLSNVYGRVEDHADRVVPAFARAAVEGSPMVICGRGHTFDFTHVDDVVRGLVCLVEALEGGLELPPIHFATGRPTTLGELAALANALGRNHSELIDGPERDYDVDQFVGDPGRAWELLQWRPQVDLRDGLRWLMRDFAQLAQDSHEPASRSSECPHRISGVPVHRAVPAAGFGLSFAGKP
jgi:nucleoside-diphosphate-sugar epimerase